MQFYKNEDQIDKTTKIGTKLNNFDKIETKCIFRPIYIYIYIPAHILPKQT